MRCPLHDPAAINGNSGNRGNYPSKFPVSWHFARRMAGSHSIFTHGYRGNIEDWPEGLVATVAAAEFLVATSPIPSEAVNSFAFAAEFPRYPRSPLPTRERLHAIRSICASRCRAKLVKRGTSLKAWTSRSSFWREDAARTTGRNREGAGDGELRCECLGRGDADLGPCERRQD